MKSVRTLDSADIRKYVQWLGILAVGCVLLRVLWVADVVVKVKEEVKYANDHQGETTTDEYSTGDNNGGDASTHPHYDNQTVVAIGVQAAMIAMVIIAAWYSCFRRALRLHMEVSLRPGNNAVPATAPG